MALLLGTSLLLLYLAGIPLPGRAGLRTQPGPTTTTTPRKNHPSLFAAALLLMKRGFSDGTQRVVSIARQVFLKQGGAGILHPVPSSTAPRQTSQDQSLVSIRGGHRGSGPRLASVMLHGKGARRISEHGGLVKY